MRRVLLGVLLLAPVAACGPTYVAGRRPAPAYAYSGQGYPPGYGRGDVYDAQRRAYEAQRRAEIRDRQEDIRDHREDVRDRREDWRDRQEYRRDRQEDRRDRWN